jgi:hypothetical protein
VPFWQPRCECGGSGFGAFLAVKDANSALWIECGVLWICCVFLLVVGEVGVSIGWSSLGF